MRFGNNLKRNSLQIKILLFFTIGFVILGVMLLFIGDSNNRRIQSLYDARVKEESAVLAHDLAGITRLTRALAPDYSQWDDPYNYMLGKLPKYAVENLTKTTLETFESDAMWMFYNEGKLAYKINQTEDTEDIIDFTPIQQTIKQKFAKDYFIQFYVKTKNGVMCIFGSTIVQTDDPKHSGNSPGYLLVGKLISNDALASLQGGERQLVTFMTPEQLKMQPRSFPTGSGKLAYHIDYVDIDGKTIGHVYANYEAASIRALYNSGVTLLVFVDSAFFALLMALLLAIWRWVIRPVNKISYGLEKNDSSVLQKIAEENTEFGKMARLIDKFFEQEKITEIEIREKKKFLDQLSASNTEIEQTNKVMIGRELRMIELKKEINALKEELGRKI